MDRLDGGNIPAFRAGRRARTARTKQGRGPRPRPRFGFVGGGALGAPPPKKTPPPRRRDPYGARLPQGAGARRAWSGCPGGTERPY